MKNRQLRFVWRFRCYLKKAGIWFWALLLLISLDPTDAGAHPHIFIANRIGFELDENGLAGIRVTWVFDEMFSAMLTEDYDRNNNGEFESDESEVIRKEAFDFIKQYDYFTFMRIDDRPFKVKYVSEFSVHMKNGQARYDFLIPCHVTSTGGFKSVAVSQYDPTYYTAILLEKDPGFVAGVTGGVATAVSVAENPDVTYYFGMLHPIEVILRFKRE